MTSSNVVTRFAPSPTGFLHIGGARTALFNWLFARGRGGKFLLRIEDTDRARHSEEAVSAILEGLTWLGLDWDGEPISQYANKKRHQEIAAQLLESGSAYRCFMTPEELESAREQARSSKTRFESPWRDRDPASAPTEQPFVIRFKAPRTGETQITDAVQGDVTFPNGALDDLIIQRSDGAPTYNLAVVVDDHDMGITHIIRGDDHLNNAALQSQIYDALGWKRPVFTHVPLIHGDDGAKLSKRHGALGVEAYRDLGYLPDGLSNYLLRLGWAHGDEEIIGRERALEIFDLEGLNKAPARLDFKKLAHVNGHYISMLTDDEFATGAAPFLEQAGVSLTPENHARLLRSAPFLKPRCETLKDLETAAAYLFLERPLDIAGKAAKPLRKEGATDALTQSLAALEVLPSWSGPDAISQCLERVASQMGVGFGAIGAPLRAALTAGRPSPQLGEVLYGLGKSEAIARLRDRIHPPEA
ncbi:MAG: glutamate--tRNA ligase [Pseudomonadota bacterium]